MYLGSLCVPPKPGIVPILISGCPNCAFSPAIIISHNMANSQPPPNANLNYSQKNVRNPIILFGKIKKRDRKTREEGGNRRTRRKRGTKIYI